MIVYFANRELEILGSAHTNLKNGYIIINDKKVEDVDTSVGSFSCTMIYDRAQRLDLETMAAEGNYILRYEGDHAGRDNKFTIDGTTDFFTIIEVEINEQDQTVYIYAEDAGLDLLNDLAPAYGSQSPQSVDHYVNRFLTGTGFVIRNNTMPPETQLALNWDSEENVTARLNSLAQSFECEFSFGVDISGFNIDRRWIDIDKERGTDTQELLSVNINVNNLVVKKSISNVATSLLAKGRNDITLKDYDPPSSIKVDDFTINGLYLESAIGLSRWSRPLWDPNSTGHIRRVFSCDAEDQRELYLKAADELKKRIEPEINYEVDISALPEGVRIGDRVNLVDTHGEIYLSSRILKLETSITQVKKDATLGEYLIKSSGIAQKVKDLATAFSEMSEGETLYTWTVYADDRIGTNATMISNNQFYVGYLPNREQELTSDSQLTPEIISKIKFASVDSGIIKSLTQQYYVDIDGKVEDPSTDIPESSWSDELPLEAWAPETVVYSREEVTTEIPGDPGELPWIRVTTTTPKEATVETSLGDINEDLSNKVSNSLVKDEVTTGSIEWSQEDNSLHIVGMNDAGNAAYETVIGGDGIKFKYNGNTVASIDQNELNIDKTVVITSMRVGDWLWSVHDNSNLTLKWGGE